MNNNEVDLLRDLLFREIVGKDFMFLSYKDLATCIKSLPENNHYKNLDSLISALQRALSGYSNGVPRKMAPYILLAFKLRVEERHLSEREQKDMLARASKYLTSVAQISRKAIGNRDKRASGKNELGSAASFVSQNNNLYKALLDKSITQSPNPEMIDFLTRVETFCGFRLSEGSFRCLLVDFLSNSPKKKV